VEVAVGVGRGGEAGRGGGEEVIAVAGGGSAQGNPASKERERGVGAVGCPAAGDVEVAVGVGRGGEGVLGGECRVLEAWAGVEVDGERLQKVRRTLRAEAAEVAVGTGRGFTTRLGVQRPGCRRLEVGKWKERAESGEAREAVSLESSGGATPTRGPTKAGLMGGGAAAVVVEKRSKRRAKARCRRRVRLRTMRNCAAHVERERREFWCCLPTDGVGSTSR